MHCFEIAFKVSFVISLYTGLHSGLNRIRLFSYVLTCDS